MKRATIFFTALVLLLGLVFGCVQQALSVKAAGRGRTEAGPAVSEDITVVARTGTYIGLHNNGVVEFLGIRYAETPERWKAPKDVETTSSDIIPARQWGDSCIQPFHKTEGASLWNQSIDCLTLNIWTKNPAITGKPVLVFIHGGGGVSGGTYDPCYDGENFVRNLPRGEDAVLVTMNYRLGLFGTLDLEGLDGYTDEYKDSINVWLLDQIQALKWINENISAFGGDPENVTLFGQSAGAGFTATHLCIEESRKYIHKAIIESGPLFNRQITKEKCRETSNDIFSLLEVSNVDELLAVTEDDIRAKLMGEGRMPFGGAVFFPVADGDLVPLDCYKELKTGCAANIDVMIGTTDGERDEVAMDRDNFPNPVTDPDDIMSVINKYENTIRGSSCALRVKGHEGVVEEYLAMYEDKVMGMTDLLNDLNYRQGSILLAEAQSKWNDNTYMYIWNWAPEVDSVLKAFPVWGEISPYGRALHFMEVMFVFNNPETCEILTGPAEDLPETLMRQTMYTWYSFAKTGNPSNPQIPIWESYNNRTRMTMIIDSEWNLVADLFPKRRIVLNKLFP
jgi:para-nitrobenzyl esterase